MTHDYTMLREGILALRLALCPTDSRSMIHSLWLSSHTNASKLRQTCSILLPDVLVSTGVRKQELYESCRKRSKTNDAVGSSGVVQSPPRANAKGTLCIKSCRGAVGPTAIGATTNGAFLTRSTLPAALLLFGTGPASGPSSFVGAVGFQPGEVVGYDRGGVLQHAEAVGSVAGVTCLAQCEDRSQERSTISRCCCHTMIA